MYAIIEDSGTQIKVSAGETIEVDCRTLPGGAEKIVFERVLAIGAGDGTPAKLGAPYLSGASVSATIVEETRGPRLRRGMYKRRKGTRKQGSHRQDILLVRIDAING